MKYKTAEITGALLDAAVAKALNVPLRVFVNGMAEAETYDVPFDTGPSESESGDIFEPSTMWAHGGPIIERERVNLRSCDVNDVVADPYWAAIKNKPHPELYATSQFWSVGPTPLIAAMRAYVASKLGDEVELP